MLFPQTFPVTAHTNYVSLGGVFVAIKGTQEDGTAYIPEAVARGARTIIVEHAVEIAAPVQAIMAQSHVSCVRVDDARKALAQWSAQAAGYPARQLIIVGITGTKGKTTTAFMAYHMLRTIGYKTALISTVKNSINGVDFPPSLTTPQSDYLHQFFALCLNAGVTHVVMEVAAHAVTLHRTDGIEFDGIVFTNFGLEHLEFYATLDDYFAAKCRLLEQRKSGAFALVNNDNEWTARLKFTASNVSSFGCITMSDIMATDIVEEYNRQTFVYNKQLLVQLPLIGSCNVYNALAALGLLASLGIQLSQSIKALSSFAGVPGRCESYQLSNGATCIIDYAHNPLSYRAILEPLRNRTEYLIVVFGAGGKRDPNRRPLMGALAAQYADMVIITSDNPRIEDPYQIMEDIVAGIKPHDMHKVIKEIDREQAIRIAYSLSKQGSIIVLLGKGPDEYQIIGTVKYPFSEASIVKSL